MTSRRTSFLLISTLLVVALGYYAATERPRWARQSYYALTTHALGRAEGYWFADSITLDLSNGLQRKMAEIAAVSSAVPAERQEILQWQTPDGEFWAPVGTLRPEVIHFVPPEI